MRKQDSQLQADRRRVEGYEMLSKLKENEFKLSVVADDLEVDTNMRYFLCQFRSFNKK